MTDLTNLWQSEPTEGGWHIVLYVDEQYGDPEGVFLKWVYHEPSLGNKDGSWVVAPYPRQSTDYLDGRPVIPWSKLAALIPLPTDGPTVHCPTTLSAGQVRDVIIEVRRILVNTPQQGVLFASGADIATRSIAYRLGISLESTP